jgi:hypothetical protein
VEKRRDAARQRVMSLLREQLVRKAVETLLPGNDLEALLDRIAQRETDPYTIVEEIVRDARFEK